MYIIGTFSLPNIDKILPYIDYNYISQISIKTFYIPLQARTTYNSVTQWMEVNIWAQTINS